MTSITVIALLAAYAWFATWTGFLVVASAKRVRDEGLAIPHGGRMVVYIWLLLGGPGDVLYNLIIGTATYKELPRELLFSHRIERLANGPAGWRRDKALPLAMVLNAADDNHIDIYDAK